jgi:hypothetical protein
MGLPGTPAAMVSPSDRSAGAEGAAGVVARDLLSSLQIQRPQDLLDALQLRLGHGWSQVSRTTRAMSAYGSLGTMIHIAR